MIVPPDLIVVARECIRSGLTALGVAGVPVSTRVPSPRPPRFITFDVKIGPKKNLRVGRNTVIVHVHDALANEVACRDLARQVSAVLEDASNTVSMVTWVQPESITRSDDPDLTSTARYQVVVTWYVAYPV